MAKNGSSNTVSDPSKLNLIIGVRPMKVRGTPCDAYAVVC